MDTTHVGPYRLERLLGRGGMGRVHLAVALEETGEVPPGQRVAVKVLRGHLLARSESRERFLREAALGASVRHPNVIRALDSGVAVIDGEERPYLVMEYVEGQTLKDLGDELGALPEEMCLHVACEVARGLRALHEAGIVHRDLKPGNVMLTADHAVKLMDLGVALPFDATHDLSDTGSFVGSVPYASPEQFGTPRVELDGRADLFALGVVLYELATGQHPFRHEQLRVVMRRILQEAPRRLGTLNPQLSPFLEEVVHTLLAKARDDRFASAADLVAVLEAGEASMWWTARAHALRLETKRALRRPRMPRETALLGRNTEMSRLERAWNAVAEGEGAAVLIEGEAGIGKTRLVDEFVTRVAAGPHPANVLYGAWAGGGAATPTGALTAAFREYLGAGALEEALQPALASAPLLLPAFAARLRGEPPPEGVAPLTPASLETAFVLALRGIASSGPTIVWLDDLHFAPAEGRALVAALALALRQHPVLLVATARPGLPDAFLSDLDRLAHVDRLPLTRLGAKDLVGLLEEAFHSTRLAELLGTKIARASDGNPFFVFEIIRGLREDRSIAKRPDGAWVSTRVIKELEVPSSVADLIHARMQDLDDAERHVLEVASCCGYAFDGLLVAEAAGEQVVPTLRRLGRLERLHHLVRSSGRGFVFDHHQVQEILYRDLSPPLREAYHARIADAIEARHGDEITGGTAVALCEHLFAAREEARARTFLEPALEHLAHIYAAERGADLAGRALDVPGLLEGSERVRALVHRATALDLLALRKPQEAAAREAVATAREAEDGELLAHALSTLGTALGVTGQHEEAAQVLTEARDVASAAGALWGAARAQGNLGVVLGHMGLYADALPHLEAAVEGARAVGKSRAATRALGNLGSTLLACGRADEARACIERQLEEARSDEDLPGEAFATGNLGTVLLRTGEAEEALGYFERQLELEVATGNRRGEGIAHGMVAMVHVEAGRTAAARRHANRQREIAFEVADRWSESRALSILGTLAFELGRLQEARVLIRAWHQNTLELADRASEAWALNSLAYLEDAAGNEEAALRHLEEALLLRPRVGDRWGEAADHLALGRIREEAGDLDAARQAYATSLAISREAEIANVRIIATLRVAALDPAHLAEAVDEWATVAPQARFSQRFLARWLLYGLTEDVAHLEAAHDHLLHLVEHAPEEAKAGILESVVLHRDIEDAWQARQRG